MKTQKIIYYTNSTWALFNLYQNILKGARDAGLEVIACAPIGSHVEHLKTLRIRFIDIPMDAMGKNPFYELLTFVRLWNVFLKERPDIVHNLAVKAMIYGTLAARLAGVRRVINTLAGRGYSFLKKGLLFYFVTILFRFIFQLSSLIIFVNPNDRNYFIYKRLVSPSKTVLILGHGVDINRFKPDKHGKADGKTHFLMLGRMLWAKGVSEYLEAAKKINSNIIYQNQASFRLLGGSGTESAFGVPKDCLFNSLLIPTEWLKNYSQKSNVEWIPHQEDVRSFLAEADVVVLPTYYPEGLPRTILEAMACAKVVITTDVPGCRQAVEHGMNGLLVKPRDSESLAGAMEYLIQNPHEIRRMGAEGRKRVLARFSDEHIIRRTLQEYRKLGIAF